MLNSKSYINTYHTVTHTSIPTANYLETPKPTNHTLVNDQSSSPLSTHQQPNNQDVKETLPFPLSHTTSNFQLPTHNSSPTTEGINPLRITTISRPKTEEQDELI